MVTFTDRFKINCFLIILTTLAIVTRFYKIDSESLWLDEAFSFWLNGLLGSIKNLSTYFTVSNSVWWDPHPFFYYLILHYWITLAGTSEFALRSLSALFGILTILLTCHIGNRFLHQKVGVLASILVLLSPLNLWYSQEARMYTLTSLLMLLSIYFCIALTTARKNVLNSIFYVISSTMLIYTDYIGLFVIIFQMLYVFCYLGYFKKYKINVFLWCYCVMLLLYIPWLPALYHMASSSGGTHLPALSIRSGVKVLLFYMVDAGVDDFQTALLPFASHTAVKALIGIAGLACWIMAAIAAVLSLRKRSDSGVLLAIICCIPATLFFISISIKPVFCSKQISGFVPEMALLIAMGIVYSSQVHSMVKINWLYQLLIASFILVVVVNSYNFYLLYHVTTKENWRDTARYVESNFHQNDSILLLLNAQGPFQYYMRGYPGIKTVNDVTEITALTKTSERCWLVYSDMEKKAFEAEINHYLNDKAHKVIRRKFRGTNVVFYQAF